MTGNVFTSDQFWSHQAVYIDTATLMNVGSMKLFISNYGDEIRRSGNRIKVPLSVQHELSRHYQRRNYQKSTAAMESKILMSNHSCLFDLQGENWLDKKELDEAFADPDLLATLTLNKAKGNQTLITNDRMLGENALDINKWQSCSGYAITICYVDRHGKLCKWNPLDTMNMDINQSIHEEESTPKEETTVTKTESKEPVRKKEVKEKPKVQASNTEDEVRIDIHHIVLSAVWFLSGMISARYAKDAVLSAKHVTYSAFGLISQLHSALM